MGRKVRTPKAQSRPASPFVRVYLGTGAFPKQRVHGWVAAFAGADDVSKAELVERYGDQVRQEAAAAGFEPACDVPLKQQSADARLAAEQWAARVIAEGN